MFNDFQSEKIIFFFCSSIDTQWCIEVKKKFKTFDIRYNVCMHARNVNRHANTHDDDHCHHFLVIRENFPKHLSFSLSNWLIPWLMIELWQQKSHPIFEFLATHLLFSQIIFYSSCKRKCLIIILHWKKWSMVHICHNNHNQFTLILWMKNELFKFMSLL